MVCRQCVSQFNDKLSFVHKLACKPIYRRKKKVSVLIVNNCDLSVENADHNHSFSLYRPCSGAPQKTSCSISFDFLYFNSAPVHTNPFPNENGAVLLLIQLSSTLKRRKRPPKTEPFDNALQSGAI